MKESTNTLNQPVSIDIIRKDTLAVSQWSGGTSTQLAIYPKNGDYGRRDFMWRISSATVEIDKSEFTSLNGIKRYITSLSGNLRLEHEGHHCIDLKPFEIDAFSGDWKTVSFGKVTDFNLMLNTGCDGILRCEKVKDSDQIGFKHFTSDDSSKQGQDQYALGIYPAEDTLVCQIGQTTYSLVKGDLLLLSALKPESQMIEILEGKNQSICIVETRAPKSL